MNPDDTPKAPAPRPPYRRSDFLAQLSRESRRTADVDVSLKSICDKEAVVIADCPPAILYFVMDVVRRGDLESYNVRVSSEHGGLLVTFGAVTEEEIERWR